MMDTNGNNIEISILIPLYNNETTLLILLERLYNVVGNVLFENKNIEIIFINDGSKDNSRNVILNFWKRKKDNIIIKIVDFTKNFGQLSAILCGMKESSGNCVATLSADMQDPPELILSMYEGWKNGVYINLGYRKNRADGTLNKLFSKIFYLIVKQYHENLPIGGFDYVLLDRKVIDHLLQMNYKNRFLQGDILSLGYTMKWYSYKRGQPANKENKLFKPFKINYFIDSIFHTKFLISFLFMESVLIIMAGLIMMFTHFFIESKIPLSVSFITFLLGIINMSFTAVIAYSWRIYNDMKIKPDYIVNTIEVI